MSALRADQAARLLGGAKQLKDEIGADYGWVEGEIQARTAVAAREALGPEAWTATEAAGRSAGAAVLDDVLAPSAR
jgi:hypothetical protein